jgi:hypothetical protein
MRSGVIRWAVWAALGVATGCSSKGTKAASSEGPTAADDMAEVAGLLRDFAVQYNRGPARLADLAANEPLYTRGYRAIQAGEIVVVWGAAVSADPKGGGTRIVAYEKKVGTAGGNVLLENGEVKQVSAAEFQAAPKAR